MRSARGRSNIIFKSLTATSHYHPASIPCAAVVSTDEENRPPNRIACFTLNNNGAVVIDCAHEALRVHRALSM